MMRRFTLGSVSRLPWVSGGLALMMGVSSVVAQATPPQLPIQGGSTALLVADSQAASSAGVSASLALSAFQQAYRNGVLLYRHGNYAEALSAFYKAEALDPDHVNTHYYLALVLDALSQTDASKADAAKKYFTLVSAYGSESAILLYARKRLAQLEQLPNASSTPNRSLTPSAASALASSSSVSAGLTTTVHQVTQALQQSLQQSLANGSVSASDAIAIPLLNQTNALMVTARLNDAVSGTFVVDTGATYTSISQEMADQLAACNGLRYVGTVRITTANGQIDVPKVVIDRVRIHGLEARNVEATVINLHKGGSFSGLLGLSFLRNFQVTINPQSNQLVFRSL
ncbi:MAG: retroviral-like aspartic protease family protein [Vampirovibrionales bacterium]